MRDSLRVRGEWLLESEQAAAAASRLGEAVRMAREEGKSDLAAEALLLLLLLARLRTGQCRTSAMKLTESRIHPDRSKRRSNPR